MNKFLKTFVVCSVLIMIVFPCLLGDKSQAATIEPTVTVKLKWFLGNQSSITIKPSQLYEVTGSDVTLQANTEYQVKIERSNVILLKDGKKLEEASQFTVKPSTYSGTLSINNRLYLGTMMFTNESEKYVRPVNTIPMEDYLKGVVPKEVYTSWHADALKSQAVAARTYALSYTNKVIDDTTSYQVYGGYEWYSSTTSAVDQTSGQVVTYNGSLINSVFSSSNGGIIESDFNAWGKSSQPYFKVKNDPYDPQTKWTLTLQKQQIDLSNKDLKNPNAWWNETKEADEKIAGKIKAQMLTNASFKGKDIKITSIKKVNLYQPTSGQRMSKGDLSVSYITKGDFDQSGKLAVRSWDVVGTKADTIRMMLDGTRFKSLIITNQKADDTTITIEGKGNGHGVGLSQFGANSMASKGKAYSDILAFYYPGTALTTQYTDKIQRVTTPEAAKVDPMTDEDTKITGTAEPNSTIMVKDWPTVIATGQTDANGHFSIDVPKQKADTQIHVLVKGEGGYSKYTWFLVKGTKRAVPDAAKVDPMSDEDTAITGTAEPNSTIMINVWPTVIATGKADNTGHFSVPVPKQEAGKQIHVLVKGEGGYSKYTWFLVQSQKVPDAAQVNPMSDEDTAITGTAEPNSTIMINVWPTVIATGKADNDGHFSVSVPKQVAGKQIHVLVKGEGGYSKYTWFLVQSQKVPDAAQVNPMTSTDTKITGSAEPNSTIMVKDWPTVIATGQTNNDGHFSINVPKQKAGTQIHVLVKGQAGYSKYTWFLVK
ncbi:SpoIID/LytB domain-containing protein [Priestia aryabhattai]|uniref:SpoIID/LytB domain-containing protein n=1 Tax=Priestia aryabhattai TaxID=412384 RepID=UPI002377DCDE|nr:SpoIID/LytB domain-containing protein [Priestia aryabhattai]WDL88482.1 SpoIID/LytB domain-containing protein [Priestia aryabhattai]